MIEIKYNNRLIEKLLKDLKRKEKDLKRKEKTIKNANKELNNIRNITIDALNNYKIIDKDDLNDIYDTANATLRNFKTTDKEILNEFSNEELEEMNKSVLNRLDNILKNI